MTNHGIARRLLEYARGLSGAANLYRVRSYRRAAMIVDGLDRPVVEIGLERLAELPGIGTHLAFTIDVLARTGEFVAWPPKKGKRRSAA